MKWTNRPELEDRRRGTHDDPNKSRRRAFPPCKYSSDALRWMLLLAAQPSSGIVAAAAASLFHDGYSEPASSHSTALQLNYDGWEGALHKNGRSHPSTVLPWTARDPSDYVLLSASPRGHDSYHPSSYDPPSWLEPTLEAPCVPRLALSLPLSPADVFCTEDDDGEPATATEPSHPYAHASRTRRLAIVRTTGTTIVGVVGKDCIVLGADTRATVGSLVADTRASKIHILASNVAACGAGTSADLSHLTALTRHSLRLQNLPAVGNDPIDASLDDPPDPSASVEHACRFLLDYLYERGGSCQANLLVGGVSESGAPELRAVHPHGSADALAFGALGSGGLAAMAVLERDYRPNLSSKEAVDLVQRAVVAGIDNDLGSGSQVDVCVIHCSGTSEHLRASIPEESLPTPPRPTVDSRDDEGETPPRTQLGVNGFGNAPFTALKGRQICKFPDDRHERAWNALLGL